MRVIGITGASGFVGSRLCAALASAPETRVAGIDLLSPVRETPNLKFEQMDIRDPRLGEFFRGEGVGAVVHLACVFDPVHDRRMTREIHVEGTRNLLAAVEACGADQLLYLSSTFAYGAHPDNPARLDEESPFRPNIDCSLSIDQVEMERLVLGFAACHPAIRVGVVRSCAALGAGANHFIARALQEPLIFLPAGADPEIQLIDTEDLIAACLLILKERRGGIWNVAGEGTMRISDCLARLGTPVRRLPAPVLGAISRTAWRLRLPLAESPPGLLPFLRHGCVATTERARREIGFTPRYSTVETLDRFLKSFL